MSIFSKAKAKAKKAYNTVKNTITGGLSKIGNSFSNTASAIGSVVTGKTALGATKNTPNNIVSGATGKSGSTNYYNNYVPTGGASGNYQGVSTGTTQYGPAQPTSYSSGNQIKRPPPIGGGGQRSDTSTQSYNGMFTAASGSGLPSPVNTTVNANQISSQRNSTGSGAPQYTPSNYESDVRNNNIQAGANPATGMFDGNAGADQNVNAKDAKKTAQEVYLESLMPQPDERDAQAQAERESGVIQARQQKQNTQNEINGITTKMNTDLLKLRGVAAQEGVVEAVYGGQQAQVTREATIRLLPLQAQLAVDEGNLDQAESKLDSLFKIYSSDAKKSVDLWNEKAKIIYDGASAKEKAQLDAVADQKKFTLNNINDVASMQRQYMSESKVNNKRLFNALKDIQPPHNINSATIEQDYQNFRDDVNEAVAKYSASANTSGGVLATLPVSIQNKVLSIATGFESKDIVKKYNATVDAINVVNGIDPKSKNPADHQQVVYAFAKALDPDSAVREGEYATIKKYAQSLTDKYKKEISNAVNGTGFLSEAAIKNIQSTMNNTYKSRKPIYDNAVSETSRIINNVAGGNVAGEIIADYSGGVTSKQPPIQGNPPTVTKSGKTFDVQAAIQSGYSQQEINDYLNSH